MPHPFSPADRAAGYRYDISTLQAEFSLTNLPALREIGSTANRRLLRVQSISHDPITGADADALHAITAPVITETGTRIPGLRLGEQRSHALLTALPLFQLQPNGFANKDLRTLTAQLRAIPAEQVTVGQMTYDLRRLRARGLITRIPHTHRYTITEQGLHTAMFLSAAHDRFLPTGLAHLADHATPTCSFPRIPNCPRKSQPHNRTRRLTPPTESDNTNLTHKSGFARSSQASGSPSSTGSR